MGLSRQFLPSQADGGGRAPLVSSGPETDEAQDLYGNQFLQCQSPEQLVCGPGSEDPAQNSFLAEARAPAATPVVPATPTPASYHPPAEASNAELYAFYSEIAARNGNVHPIGPNGEALPTVLGLRGIDTNGRVHETQNRRNADPAHGQEGGYDDTLVILHPDGHVEVMPYSSHPFQNHSGASPDVDGKDGGDVGIIRPGEYYAQHGAQHAGDSAWSVRQERSTTDAQGRVHVSAGDDHIPAWRDTNHDFRVSDAERTASEGRRRGGEGVQNNANGDYANGVLFHQIRPGVPTDSSIACQVMPHRNNQGFEGLKTAVGTQSDFNYVLVDVNQPERPRN